LLSTIINRSGPFAPVGEVVGQKFAFHPLPGAFFDPVVLGVEVDDVGVPGPQAEAGVGFPFGTEAGSDEDRYGI